MTPPIFVHYPQVSSSHFKGTSFLEAYVLVWLLLSTAQGLGSILLSLGIVEALFFWMTTLEFSTVGLSWVGLQSLGRSFVARLCLKRILPHLYAENGCFLVLGFEVSGPLISCLRRSSFGLFGFGVLTKVAASIPDVTLVINDGDVVPRLLGAAETLRISAWMGLYQHQGCHSLQDTWILRLGRFREKATSVASALRGCICISEMAELRGQLKLVED